MSQLSDYSSSAGSDCESICEGTWDAMAQQEHRNVKLLEVSGTNSIDEFERRYATCGQRCRLARDMQLGTVAGELHGYNVTLIDMKWRMGDVGELLELVHRFSSVRQDHGLYDVSMMGDIDYANDASTMPNDAFSAMVQRHDELRDVVEIDDSDESDTEYPRCTTPIHIERATPHVSPARAEPDSCQGQKKKHRAF